MNSPADDRDRLLADLDLALRRSPRRPLPDPWRASPSGLGWADFGQALTLAHGDLLETVETSCLAEAVHSVVGETWGCTPGAAELLDREAGPFDSETLDGLPWMVASGHLAVARSAAVAVDASLAPVRRQLLLTESLLLLVPSDALVDDLDAAYERIDPGSLARGYFTFISGPSKTADIEQTLVQGAHGPRHLAVLPFG